jgi:hypothetical protein
VDFQTCQQDGLMVGGLGDATLTDLGSLACGQYHIHQLDLAQFFKDAPRFVSQSGRQTALRKRLPKNVSQEADQDVRQHPIFFLMPDRPEHQVAFVDAERRLGLGQLDVGLPQVFVTPIRHVAAQEVAPFA